MCPPNERFYDIIDLSMDDDFTDDVPLGQPNDDDGDIWMEDTVHYYCPCGDEIFLGNPGFSEHQCPNCNWFDNLTVEEWAAICALLDMN